MQGCSLMERPRVGAEVYRYLAGAILLFVMAGCAELSQSRLEPMEESHSLKVLEQLRQKESIIVTLKGLFLVSISGAGIPLSQDLNGVVSYQQPDQVRLKGFIRLGVPVLDFYREGDHYELFFPAEGRMVSGRVDGDGHVSEWDQTIMLSLRALDAVLGKVAGLGSPNVHVLKDDRYYSIDQVFSSPDSAGISGEALVRTKVDAQTLEVNSIDYFQSGDDLIVSVECEDYRAVKNKKSDAPPFVRLPFKVRATDHRVLGGSVTLTFREFLLNAAS